MGRRKSSKGLKYYVFFWLAPLLGVVLAPLYLHIALQDATEFVDDDVYAFLVLFVTIFGLSGLGCMLNSVCICPRNFPFLLLIAQIAVASMAIAAIVFRYTPFHAGGALQISLQAAPGAPLKRSALPQTKEAEYLSPALALPRAHVGHFPEQAQQAAAVPPLLAASQSVAAPQAVAVSQAVAPFSAGAENTKAKTAASLDLTESSVIPGWRDAGDGYCEDSDSHQEFSSTHATGKTLQECADAAASDKYSVAIDFSASDGGCDIRLPAGFLGQEIPGFAWYSFGTGEGKPAGFGKQKHATSTRCYARITTTRAPGAPEDPIAPLSTKLHPMIRKMTQTYCFRSVMNQRSEIVNIVLVRAPWQSRYEEQLFDTYKSEILFLGVSSLEDFPLPPPNPFSPHFPKDKYVGLFPGFLNMYRDPEKIYPSHVKTVLLSQSDFSLPAPQPPVEKLYDFTFSGSDQDIATECVGWSMFCKNWSFAYQALEVMCGELDFRGVLAATIDKQGVKACAIPASCKGKMKQTLYLSQDEFHGYVKQSRFLFLPQMHDASPRVATQALALNVPLLMNRNLIGGWKYLNKRTGEFFHDLSDFKQSAQRLVQNIRLGGVYEPRKYADETLGDGISGATFFKFVDENFKHRVKLPEGTTHLYPVGA